MSVLKEICDKKHEHVASMKTKMSQADIENAIDATLPKNVFEQALKERKDAEEISIIAEVKKASPSKGVIRTDFNPKNIAKAYDNAGATCISCLTDEPYFQGTDAYFKDVKSVTNIPALRKDFMVDLYQIYESRMLGADAILIIMAALDDNLAKDMFDLSTELGMSALFEVHNQEELDRALRLSPRIVGVNNRDLKTLKVSLHTSKELISIIPSNIISISESGISSQKEIIELKEQGFNGFLIGESLMRNSNEQGFLSELLAS